MHLARVQKMVFRSTPLYDCIAELDSQKAFLEADHN